MENSKSAIRRLIKSSGIKLNNQVVNNENYLIKKELFNDNFIKISIGKKRHFKIILI